MGSYEKQHTRSTTLTTKNTMNKYVFLLLTIFNPVSVRARQCFNCLNGEYSGPDQSLLSLNQCGDFNSDDETITTSCLRTERCYIASMNETLITLDGSHSIQGELHVCSEIFFGVDFCQEKEDGCYEYSLDYEDNYGSVVGHFNFCCCSSDLCNSSDNEDYMETLI